jgi:hypothetical protein
MCGLIRFYFRILDIHQDIGKNMHGRVTMDSVLFGLEKMHDAIGSGNFGGINTEELICGIVRAK